MRHSPEEIKAVRQFVIGWLVILTVVYLIFASRAEASEIELQSAGNDEWVLRYAE